MKTLFIVGLGTVGSYTLDLLASKAGVKIYVTDIRREDAIKRIDFSSAIAYHQGYYPNIEFIDIDLLNTKTTSQVLRSILPDVILNTSCLTSWWIPRETLPKAIFEELEPQANDISTQITLIYCLMKAVKESGIKTYVINGSMPDITNCALGKIGLAPTIGLGNIDIVVQILRVLVSKELNVKPKEVLIYMIGHHGILSKLFAEDVEGLPHFLKIIVQGKDVTDRCNLRRYKYELKHFRPPLPEASRLVASSASKNILAIINDHRVLTHAPGPNGLPGGYPIRLGAEGAEVMLPESISLKEALEINNAGQLMDGIEEITGDGSIVFSDRLARAYGKYFNLPDKRFNVEACQERAKRFLSAFENLRRLPMC